MSVRERMEDLGFSLVHTGGNCTAYELWLAGGLELCVTAYDDATAPDSMDDAVAVGIHTREDSDPLLLLWFGTLAAFVEALERGLECWAGPPKEGRI